MKVKKFTFIFLIAGVAVLFSGCRHSPIVPIIAGAIILDSAIQAQEYKRNNGRVIYIEKPTTVIYRNKYGNVVEVEYR